MSATNSVICETNIPLIKENLEIITKHFTSNTNARPNNQTKSAAAKIHNLLISNNGSPLERFYFIYTLCKSCSRMKQTELQKFLKVILPPTVSTHSKALVSDIISFALCHPSIHSKVLEFLSSDVYSEDVDIDVESWDQAASLALDSPNFCAAILDRADLADLNIDKRLLAKWLHDLSRTSEDYNDIDPEQLIRYSLSTKTNAASRLESDFHYSILTFIQSGRCGELSEKFLIEIAESLSNLIKDHESDFDSTMLTDRFGQILSVAVANKVAKITDPLRSALKCLSSNQLISAVIQWQNK